ncbi:MAG: CzcE family metal-binding protein [Roseateles asaccharophilus]|uniref:CzcE family metal-binding protein n=1 Tax=Roseateles asaccharophilus TaxID=582607 RepID=UPI001D02A759|nr:CzcE family metal-binding protein [Shinella sp. XGS7]
MNRSFTHIALAFGLAMSATAASAAMGTTTLANGKSIYGATAAASQATKVVDAGSANTLNVDCGETVTFRNGDKSFSWKFDVVGHRVVDLQTIAPAGFSSKPLKVYVARNETERN